MLRYLLFALFVCFSITLTAQSNVPYKSLGMGYAYDFKAGKNDVRAQSRSHISLVYHTKVSNAFITEYALGYVKYQRHILAKDSLNYLNPAMYNYRLHGAEVMFNLKYCGIVAARSDDWLKIFPVVGIGMVGLFGESQKKINDKTDVRYYSPGPIQNYLGISAKAGVEFASAGLNKVTIAYGVYYQYNHIFNSHLQGSNHNIQLQLRYSFNFAEKASKISLE